MRVVNNLDLAGLGRVQVRLPWLPELDLWARVAVPMAGMASGTYAMPQIGDEVLVAHTAVPPLGWLVIEQPLKEAFVPLRTRLVSNGIVLFVGLGLAVEVQVRVARVVAGRCHR